MNPTSDSNIDIQDFDLIKSCRVCLLHNKNMNNIFKDTNNKIIDKIEFCTGIQLKEETGLPTQICKNCLKNLSIAHKFKTICLFSEQTLQQILLKRIKIELSENNEISINSNDSFNNDFDNCDLNELKVEERDQYCNFSLDDLKQTESENEVRRSKRRKLNVQKQSKPETTKVRKRGPYKKGGPPRLKKFKFSRLLCESCNIKFKSKQESDEHKRDVHSENVSWICEVCGKTFAHRGSHYTHVRSHQPALFACAHCDYSCSIKCDLEKHLRIHFGVKKYKCVQCNSSFHTSSNLHDHVRRCHDNVAKRFACALCTRRFHDRTKLNRHLDSHNDIKRFKCELCHSCFSRRCQWKKHLEKQHSVLVPAQRPGRRPTNLVMDNK